MQRPAEIRRFERLYLAVIGLGVVIAGLDFTRTSAVLGVALGMAVVVGSLGILLGLVLLISRRRSRIAKWVLVVLFAVGLAATVPAMQDMLEANPAAGSLALVQLALQVVALWFLFSTGGRA